MLFSGAIEALASCGRTVVHINGIMTSDIEAQRNLAVLKKTYGPSAGSTPEIAYDYAYNGNRESEFDSLIEVSFQKSTEENPSLALATAMYILSGDEEALVGMKYPEQLKFAYNKVITDNATIPVVAVKLVTIMAKIKKYLSEGSNVVIVGHSQGSLYGNQAFIGIANSNAANPRLKAFAVGTPAASIAGSGGTDASHVTCTEDRAIDGARLVAVLRGWKVLGSTVSAATETHSVPGLGHSFIDVYLEPDLAALPQIKAKLGVMLEGFLSAATSCIEMPIFRTVEMIGPWVGVMNEMSRAGLSLPYSDIIPESAQVVSAELLYAPGGFTGTIKSNKGLNAQIDIIVVSDYWYSSIHNATSWGSAIPIPVYGKIITGGMIASQSVMVADFARNPKAPWSMQWITYGHSYIDVDGNEKDKQFQLSLQRP